MRTMVKCLHNAGHIMYTEELEAAAIGNVNPWSVYDFRSNTLKAFWILVHYTAQ